MYVISDADLSPIIDGTRMGRGCVPRDYTVQPLKRSAVEMPTIARFEWPERIKAMTETKSRVSDFRTWKAWNQRSRGYCWTHSAGMAVQFLRAIAGLPYVQLSAYAVACKIVDFRDEGGWGALALEFIEKNGIPSVNAWPENSVSRSNDNPATWADAKKYRVTESWADLATREWHRNLTFDQVATLLLCRVPVVIDLDWWAHSILGMDLVNGVAAFNAGELRSASGKALTLGEFDAEWGMNEDGVGNGYGIRIINSWGDEWGERGTGVLTGSRAIPDGAVAPRAVVSTAA